MAVKLFPSNFKMIQQTRAVNDANGKKVRNSRVGLIDHATHGTAEEQFQRLLVYLDTISQGRIISKKLFAGRMFLDASSRLNAEPLVKRMALLGYFNEFDLRARIFLNIPWVDSMTAEDIRDGIAALNLHFGTWAPSHSFTTPDTIIPCDINRIARVQVMDSKSYPGPEVGDDDTDAADGIAP